MRYIPTFRSPVSESLVTTQGRVMNRPPSRGQHWRMGRFRREARGEGGAEGGGEEGALVLVRPFGAAGQGAVRVRGASKRWITSLQGPFRTSLGRACRSSMA